MGRNRWCLIAMAALAPGHGSLPPEDQARIEVWLDRVASAVRRNYDLGLEVAECARLVVGYGDTHRRGARNLALVLDAVDELAEAPDAAAVAE